MTTWLCERVSVWWEAAGGSVLLQRALPATPGRRHSIRRLTYRVVYSVRGAGAKGYTPPSRSIPGQAQPLRTT